MQRRWASFFTLFSLVFFIACSASFIAYAQSVGSGSVDPFTVDVSTNYPAPYQSVTLSPSSTLFDIAGAKITVTVNGAKAYSGSGGQTIPVTVGGPGTATTISVTTVADGQTYSKKIVLHPASVALVVEPVTTTHPFYQGRGLVSSQGEVRLVAIPDVRTSANKAIDPSTLEYVWKLGDQVLQEDSGIGKSVLDASAPQRYRDAAVSVTVTTSDQSIGAQAQTTISPVDPIVRIYENDPLMGPLFDSALADSFSMSDTEDTFRGVPYYFSGTPALSWTVNGVQNGNDQDITVRATGNGQGTAVLSFSAKDSSANLSASSLLSVIFGQKTQTGIFGL